LIGLIIIISKLVIFVTVKVTGNEIDFLSDSILYSFGPLLLMIIGAIGSDTLKKKYQ
ncbi:transcriptional regulator, partial [Mammaliicoccus sciuri]